MEKKQEKSDQKKKKKKKRLLFSSLSLAQLIFLPFIVQLKKHHCCVSI
jgi:hypothetical protein